MDSRLTRDSTITPGHTFGDVTVSSGSLHQGDNYNFSIDDGNRKYLEALRGIASYPPNDKRRIEEESEGGLLSDEFAGVLNDKFQEWSRSYNNCLFWIKGDSCKERTMLLCGIINELETRTMDSNARPATECRDVQDYRVAYFFCPATNPRYQNANAVLGGLIYHLVSREQSLISHVRTKYDLEGELLFEGENSWIVLCDILADIIQDPVFGKAYFVIDALDECNKGLLKLLDFLVQQLSTPCHVKWLVSSSNRPEIETALSRAMPASRLMTLELDNTSVSTAVTRRVQFGPHWAAAQDNFQEVTEPPEALPPPEQYVPQSCAFQAGTPSRDELWQTILRIVLVARRPLTIDELAALIIPVSTAGGHDAQGEITSLCGSFLTLLEDRTVRFVSYSVKAQFAQRTTAFDIKAAHHTVFSLSLQAMSRTLRRDIYGLQDPATGTWVAPCPDPLAPVRYSCEFWVYHLSKCIPRENARNDLEDGGSIDTFLRRYFLYWLEAVLLIGSVEPLFSNSCHFMSGLKDDMSYLKDLLKGSKSQLEKLISDGDRFVHRCSPQASMCPLQIYAAVSVLEPAQSAIRTSFQHERPSWIVSSVEIKTYNHDDGDDCIGDMKWSHDGTRFASTPKGAHIKIWDPVTGQCLSAFEHSQEDLEFVAWSRDIGRVLFGFEQEAYETRQYLPFSENRQAAHKFVAWSHDNKRVATGSEEGTIEIWEPVTGGLLLRFENSPAPLKSLAWSHDDRYIALGSVRVFKVWDSATGQCLLEFGQPKIPTDQSVTSLAWSRKDTRLAFGLENGRIMVYHADEHITKFPIVEMTQISLLAWSPDESRIASASAEGTIHIWDVETTFCRTLGGNGLVWELEFPKADLIYTNCGKFEIPAAFSKVKVIYSGLGIREVPVVCPDRPDITETLSVWDPSFSVDRMAGGHLWIRYKGRKLFLLKREGEGSPPTFDNIIHWSWAKTRTALAITYRTSIPGIRRTTLLRLSKDALSNM